MNPGGLCRPFISPPLVFRHPGRSSAPSCATPAKSNKGKVSMRSHNAPVHPNAATPWGLSVLGPENRFQSFGGLGCEPRRRLFSPVAPVRACSCLAHGRLRRRERIGPAPVHGVHDRRRLIADAAGVDRRASVVAGGRVAAHPTTRRAALRAAKAITTRPPHTRPTNDRPGAAADRSGWGVPPPPGERERRGLAILSLYGSGLFPSSG